VNQLQDFIPGQTVRASFREVEGTKSQTQRSDHHRAKSDRKPNERQIRGIISSQLC
jgi:hypothetical protein